MLAVLVMSSAAAAEQVRVAEIVVEDTAEILALQERKDDAIAKTIITRREMDELGGRTAADVLRRLPRMFFSGPPTTNKDVRMSGLDKEFQNILINGNRPPGGGEKREFALDRIPVEQIERIEVLKNPTAAYDADAIGGVVNIILKDAPPKRAIGVSFGISSNDRSDRLGNAASAHYGDTFGIIGLGASGTRIDNYREKQKDVADSIKKEKEQEQETNRTITTAFAPVITLTPDKLNALTLRPFLSDQREIKDKTKTKTNLSSGAAKSMNREKEDKDQALQSYFLEWKHRSAAGNQLKAQIGYSRNHEDKDKEVAVYTGAALAYDKRQYEAEDKIDAEKIAAFDLKIPITGLLGTDHVLSTGLKVRDKDRSVEKTTWEVSKTGVYKNTTSLLDSYTVDETITSVYIMDEAVLGNRLTVTPGVRVEMTKGRYATADGVSASDSSTDWNPSLHARYKLFADLILRGSVAQVIGRPAFKDKVPSRSVKADKVETGNPSLREMTSVNYEAGIEYYFRKGSLLGVSGFYKNIQDTIEKITIGTDSDTGLPLVMPMNVGSAKVSGVDFEAKTDFGFIGLTDFSITGSYSLLASEVKDIQTGVVRRLKDQPKSLFSAVLRYDNRKIGFDGSLGFSYIGDKIDESEPAKGRKVEKAFTQIDLSLSQRIWRDMSMFGSITNLLNEYREKTENGKIETEKVGRTMFVGLRVNF